MTYYSNSAYKERWYVRFMDLKGGSWRVSIEDPTFTGTATELTASANPLEWMGTGDDDQTKTIQGSTGTLRIMVTSEARIANLRPTELNNRRVKVTRDNVLVWLGFMKQEEYNQEWIDTPYEVELPIISALELTNDIRINSSSSVTTIAQLLKQCVASMGISVDIFTNIQISIDANGEMQSQNWMAGKLHYSCMYENLSLSEKTKYVSKMLEMVAAPLGHIREYQGNWYIMLDQNTVNYIEQEDEKTYTTTRLFKLNASNALVATGYMLSLTDVDFNIEGTDNTISMLSAPKSVEVEMNVDEQDDVIFETSEKLIQNKFLSANITESQLTYYADFDIAGKQFVKGRTMPLFRRVVKYDTDKFTSVLPIGMLFGGQDNMYTSVYVKPINGVSSKQGVSKVRMTIKTYGYLGVEESNPTLDPLDFYLKVGGMWLAKESGSWTWKTTRTRIKNEDFTDDNGTFHVDFNEVRQPSDYDLKQIELEVYNESQSWKIITVKFEYVYLNNETSALVFMNDGIDKSYEFDKVTCNGNGDDITLSYNTLRGLYPLRVSSNFAVVSLYPRNGLYDHATPDTGTRTMIDINEASNGKFALDCLETPARVTMSGKTYNAVAVGCNARECTMSLKLIQTNI